MVKKIYSKSANKVLSKMDSRTRERIKKAVEQIPRGDIVKLTGLQTSYRLRVGTWRVLYELREGNIHITNIKPRGDAYK